LPKKDSFRPRLKKFKRLIAEGKKSDAVTAMKKAMSSMDKAAKTGVIHKNKSSRLKSRIAKAIGKIK